LGFFLSKINPYPVTSNPSKKAIVDGTAAKNTKKNSKSPHLLPELDSDERMQNKSIDPKKNRDEEIVFRPNLIFLLLTGCCLNRYFEIINFGECIIYSELGFTAAQPMISAGW